MSGSELPRRLYLPSLAAELPEGWSVSEAATFTPPSGTEIHVRLNRAPDGWDASDLAVQMEGAVRAGVVGVDELAASTVPLRGGRIAHERRFACERDGAASVGRLMWLVDGGLALTVSASWPAGGDGADVEMDDALAGIRLLNRPVANVLTASDAAIPRAFVKRPPVDVSAWSELRTVWSSSNPVDSDVLGATRWSPAELAVCATILGASSFPTVGSELLGSLPEVGLNATLDAVTRSFLARGLIRAGADGFAALSDELSAVMEVAVDPDIAISVEGIGGADIGRWWFGLRPDCAVRVSVLPDGSRECGGIEPGQVIAQLLALTSTGGEMTSDAAPGSHLDRVTLADVTSGTSRVAGLVRVTTGWRTGELVRGGVLTWAVGVDGSQWLAELDATAASPSWELRPIASDGLRAQLLDHLPGT